MTNHNSQEQQDELESFYQQSSHRESHATNSGFTHNSNSSERTHQKQNQHSHHDDNTSDDAFDPLAEFYRQQEQNYGANASFVHSEIHNNQSPKTAKPNPDSYFNSAQQVETHLRCIDPALAYQYSSSYMNDASFAKSIPHRANLKLSHLAYLNIHKQSFSLRVLKFIKFALNSFALLFIVLLLNNIPVAIVYDKYHDEIEVFSTLFGLLPIFLYYGIPALLFWYSAGLTKKFIQELIKAETLEQRHYCNHDNVQVEPFTFASINNLARSQSTKVLSNVVINRDYLAKCNRNSGINLLHTILCGSESSIVSLNHFAEVSYHAQLHPELSALEVLDYYEEKFLQRLDAQAQEQIIKIAKRISVTTGLSQWSLLDMLLIYIAGMQLIERIANIYDVQISTAQRLLLARKILVLVAVGGITEELSDSASELLSNSLVAKYLGDVTQGLSNGVLLLRFGLKTIELLRPLPYKAERPTVLSMLKAFIKFSKKADTE